MGIVIVIVLAVLIAVLITIKRGKDSTNLAPRAGVSTTTQYDPSVILAFANSLYARAAWIILLYAVVGLTVGSAIGIAITSTTPDSGILPVVVCSLIIGLPAVELGRQKAFALRLQAQIALCQVQIEANTRNLSSTR